MFEYINSSRFIKIEKEDHRFSLRKFCSLIPKKLVVSY